MEKSKIKAIVLVAAVLVCGAAYLIFGPGHAGMAEKDSGLSVGTLSEQDVEVPESTEKPDISDGGSEAVDSAGQDKLKGAQIYIYICGAIKKPGVYTFDHEPRVVEVVDAAGGFAKKADRSSVNLAASLADGAQVVISEKGGHSGSSQDGVASISQTGVDAGSSQSGSDRVDINTAGPEELTNIPGIGQSKASAIVSYRQEHGRFEKPEDLMKITGIKQGIFNKIKDYIKV